MPYNRFIDPAGTVIRFGNIARENHSLDCVMLPDGKVLAVEDSYGVAFIDVKENKLLYHLDYSGNYSGLMSTYSGLKLYEMKQENTFFGVQRILIKIFRLILDAVWDGEKAVIKDSISFEAVAPAPLSLPNDIAINDEDGQKYLYVVLNGNNQLQKIRLSDKKIIWTTATGMAPFGITLAGIQSLRNQLGWPGSNR